MLKGVQRAKLRAGVAVVCSIIVIRNVIAMISHSQGHSDRKSYATSNYLLVLVIEKV